MKPGITPKPWIATKHGTIRGGEKETEVARVGRKANATLILAAPDMLEALYAVRFRIEKITNKSSLKRDILGQIFSMSIDVENAIAKAEGINQ